MRGYRVVEAFQLNPLLGEYSALISICSITKNGYDTRAYFEKVSICRQ